MDDNGARLRQHGNKAAARYMVRVKEQEATSQSSNSVVEGNIEPLSTEKGMLLRRLLELRKIN